MYSEDHSFKNSVYENLLYHSPTNGSGKRKNAFTKVKWLVYPSSTRRQQVRESHLQLESWSIRLNNKPTPGTRDVKCVVSGFGQDARARRFAADSSDRSCGLRPIPKHPATLEKKSLAPRVEEKNKPPPPPLPPILPKKQTNKTKLLTPVTYRRLQLSTFSFFFCLLQSTSPFYKQIKKRTLRKISQFKL